MHSFLILISQHITYPTSADLVAILKYLPIERLIRCLTVKTLTFFNSMCVATLFLQLFSVSLPLPLPFLRIWKEVSRLCKHSKNNLLNNSNDIKLTGSNSESNNLFSFIQWIQRDNRLDFHLSMFFIFIL